MTQFISHIQICEFVFSLLSIFSLMPFQSSKCKSCFLTQDAPYAQKAISHLLSVSVTSSPSPRPPTLSQTLGRGQACTSRMFHLVAPLISLGQTPGGALLIALHSQVPAVGISLAFTSFPFSYVLPRSQNSLLKPKTLRLNICF